MTLGGRHVASIKEREDLQQAKATILLQQKQIANYEKLIKKQNDKIRSLRHFIIRHHGKDSLGNVELFPVAQSTPTTTTNQDDSSSVSRRTDNPINDSGHDISSEDKMINIRLGIDSMNSFFFSRSDNARPPVIRHLQSPTIDQRLPVSTTTALPSSQTAAASPHTTPDRPTTTTSAAEVSPFTDEHQWNPTITSSPTWKQQHRKATTSGNHATIKRRLSQDAVWETLCSPSPEQHQDVTADVLALGHSLLHGPGSSPPSATYGQPQRTSRPILTPFCDNLSSVAQNNPDGKRKSSHFISRPTSSGFPYAEVVRNKHERSKLHGTTCTCCEKYFDTDDTHERIQRYSRHREKFLKPKTPPGYWDLDFPDSPHQ